MILEEALRIYLCRTHLDDLIESTAKFLLQHCDVDMTKRWTLIHNKLVDTFGRGMPFIEDEQKITESEIPLITEDDVADYKQAIQHQLAKLEQEIALLKAKENALDDIVHLNFEWQLLDE